MTSIYEEVDRRIAKLRDPRTVWVKHTPARANESCAVADYTPYGIAVVNNLADSKLDKHVREATDGRFLSIIGYNDHPRGAQTVDDVIVILEKFRAEL